MSDLQNPYAKFQAEPAVPDNPYAQFTSAAPAAAAPVERPGLAERLWSGLAKTAGDMATVVPRFVQGTLEGVGAEGLPPPFSVTAGGIPEGPASQFEGGPGRFAGRAVGTGAKSLAEALWEGLIKPPGKMLAGEMQPGPEAESAARGMALGMAGMGGWRPGMTLPRHQVPLAEAPPQRLLPPPTVEVAGQPATATGLGAPEMNRSAGGILLEAGSDPLMRSALRGPKPGMLPPGPSSTMTRPDASPPPTSPRAAAGLEPEAPLPVMPPAPVEAVPRNPRQDAATIDLYRRSVLPRVGGRRNYGQVTGYEGDVLTGIDKLIENQPNLKLMTPQGVELPPGTAPRTMRQFDDAIQQTKTALFEKWNPMAAQAGAEGLHIDLAPVSAELRALARKPDVVLSNPGVVRQLEEFATLYENQGIVTPLEAQNTVKNINARLTSFYEKGEAASGAPAMVLEPVARLLRKQIDEGIEATVGPGWQALRKDYGALSAIERDVTKAAERVAKMAPTTGIGKLGDFVASMEFIHALGTMSPHALARAVGAKTAGELHRFFSNPNRLIAKMFDKRIAGPPSPMAYRLSDKIVPPGFDPFLEPAIRAGAADLGVRESGGFPRMPRTSVGGP